MSFPRYPAYKNSGIDWLGGVPSHWTVKRLRRVVQLNPSKSEMATLSRASEVTFLPMEAIGEDGSLVLDRLRPIGELQSGYTYFAEGDVAIAKITPCFENGKGAVMRGLHGGLGFGTTELIVARPFPKHLDSGYLHRIFTSRPFMQQGEANMYGAGGQKRVPDDFVRDFAIAFPPVDEQVLINAFLDRETAKIDALVAEQEQLITLLKEKRQAVISHAVTKGLDPSVPMKDSGVEWIGMIPAHWNVIALKRLVKPDSSISYGIVQPGESLDHGVPFVQTTNMSNGQFDLDNLQKTSAHIAAQYPRSQLVGGEVILGIRASIGSAYVVPVNLAGANLSRGVARIDCRAEMLPQYLVNYLASNSVDTYWNLAKQGSTFNEVSIETVKELLVTVPPEAEQRRLNHWLKQQTDSFNELIVEAQTASKLLQERRSALISAAVTGQIDVRGLAPAQEQAA